MKHELYGILINTKEPDPRKAVQYSPSCDNSEWEAEDARWSDTFFIKNLTVKDDQPVLPDIYISTDSYHDYNSVMISNVPLKGFTKVENIHHYDLWGFLALRNILLVMILKRTDTIQYLREDKSFVRFKINQDPRIVYDKEE